SASRQQSSGMIRQPTLPTDFRVLALPSFFQLRQQARVFGLRRLNLFFLWFLPAIRESLRVPVQRHIDRPRWAVPLLRDDEIRPTAGTMILPVQEAHEIRVLLKRARFPQILQPWARIGAAILQSHELRQRNDRKLALISEHLQSPADVRHFIVPARAL